MNKKSVASPEEVIELLKSWRSENKPITVAFFWNPKVGSAWFMVRGVKAKFTGTDIELGSSGSYGFISLEGARVNPTSGPMLREVREFVERVEPLIPEGASVIEMVLPSQSVVVFWDSPAKTSA